MKKIGVLLLVVILLATGCGKVDKTSVINDFKTKINKTKSYELTGIMEIINDEDVFKYNLKVNYLHDDNDYYKVNLINQTNNHEQVILKNEDGVYVKTHKGITFFERVEQNILIQGFLQIYNVETFFYCLQLCTL